MGAHAVRGQLWRTTHVAEAVTSQDDEVDVQSSVPSKKWFSSRLGV